MAKLFTEGYLKEVRFTDKKVEIIIEPAPPFAIEYKEKRYMLFVSEGFGTNERKTSAALHDIDTPWRVEVNSIPDCSLSLITIKTAHAKCCFVFDCESTAITSITIM